MFLIKCVLPLLIWNRDMLLLNNFGVYNGFNRLKSFDLMCHDQQHIDLKFYHSNKAYIYS